MTTEISTADTDAVMRKLRYLHGRIRDADVIKHFDGLNLTQLIDWNLVLDDKLATEQNDACVLDGMFEDSSCPLTLVTLGELKNCALEGNKIILRAKTAKSEGRYISLQKIVDMNVDGKCVLTDKWKTFAVGQFISVGETKLSHPEIFDLIAEHSGGNLDALFEEHDFGPLEDFEHEDYESLANMIMDAATSGQDYASY